MSTLESWIFAYLINSLWLVPLVYVAGRLASPWMARIGPQAEHRLWVALVLAQSVLPAVAAFRLSGVREMAWWSTGRATSPGQVSVRFGEGWIRGGSLNSLGSELMSAAVVLYLALLLFFTLRLALRWWSLNRLRHQAQLVDFCQEKANSVKVDLVFEQQWRSCETAFDVHEARLAVSDRVFAPLTLGCRDLLVIVPEGMSDKVSGMEMYAALAHEFAHMHRGDFLKNLLYEVISLAVAFHPASWLARNRLRESREAVCDSLAAAITGNHVYARSLVRIASVLVATNQQHSQMAMGIFDVGGLERRIMRLTKTSHPLSPSGRIATLLFTGVVVMTTAVAALAGGLHASSLQPSKAAETQTGKAVHVSGSEMAGNIVYKVQPKYPEEAKKKKIQGTVHLAAVIGKDGSVSSLEPVDGPKELQPPSIDAVRQWKYKPFLINGEPVEVDTTITIIYSLAD